MEIEQFDILMEFLKVPNIAALLDQQILDELAQDAVEEYSVDLASNADYYSGLKDVDRCIDMLGKYREGSNVHMPFMLEVAQDFAAQAYPEIVKGSEVVRPHVIGDDEQALTIAKRRADFMNWQNLQQNKAWEAQTDNMLFRLPLRGCYFRKRDIDADGKQFTEIIDAENVVVHFHTDDLGSCPRVTHRTCLYPYEVQQMQRAGMILEDYIPTEDNDGDSQQPIKFLEQHRLYDLDGDGMPEPYKVLIDEEQQKVVRIAPRFTAKDLKFNAPPQFDDAGEVIPESLVDIELVEIEPISHFIKYDIIPNWDGGFYGYGYVHMLGNLNQAAEAAMNQLLDAGAAANNAGGFISARARIKAGSRTASGRKYEYIQAPSGEPLANHFFNAPVREPSGALQQLLSYIDDVIHRVAVTSSFDLSRIPSNMGQMAALQMLEQGLKAYMGVFKRMFRSLKEEFTLQQRLNAAYPPEASFAKLFPQADPAELQMLDDNIIPSADPKGVSDARQAQQAAYLDSLKGQGLNDMEITRRSMAAMQVDNIDKIMPPEPTPDEQAQQQAEQAQLKELEFKKAFAEVSKQEAEAIKAQVEVQKATAEATKIQADTGLKVLQGEKLIKETDKIEIDNEGVIDEQNNQNYVRSGAGMVQ